MGSFGRNDNRSGGFRGGSFDRGDSRRGFGGRSSFSSRGRFDRGTDRGPREMFKTTCSNCGKECEVPFRPTNGKPVYCSDCFEKMGNGERREERREFRPQPQTQTSTTTLQFEALNKKLDKIIELLEIKRVETPPTQTEPETKAEISDAKVKKFAKKLSSK